MCPMFITLSFYANIAITYCIQISKMNERLKGNERELKIPLIVVDRA